MSSDFLSKERIEQEVKEDFGSGWKDLDNDVKEQLIAGRRKRLLKKYKKIGTMGEAVENIRRGQADMYLGIAIGLSGGLVGAVVDRWFGENVVYSVLVLFVFGVLIITVHYAYNSLVKEMFTFTLSQGKKAKSQNKNK